MIVDCYTHVWQSSDQLGRCASLGNGGRHRSHSALEPGAAGPGRHLAAAEPVDSTIVLGFKSHYLDAEIPNEQVAAYVAQHPDQLIGFGGIDPSHPKEAITDLERAWQELSMRGLAVAPAAQDFHPSDSQAMLVYAAAAEKRMPVLFHTGPFTSAATKLEYARPILLDQVARELPELKIIIAHVGYPWVNETLLLLAKHEHVYAEISGLVHQPWQAYQALLGAYQSDVTGKLLFGSGFPAASASACIEALYSINHLVHGTNLPTIPREQIRGIVERETLGLLGITPLRRPREPQAETADAASNAVEV